MKIYRDGSIGTFKCYQQAALLSLVFGVTVGAIIFWKILLRIDEIALILKITFGGVVALALTILMFILYRRPLIIIKNGNFIIYLGIFNSDYVYTNEIKKIRIFSDNESVSIDIYNKSNLRVSFETKALSNLDQKIKGFIEDNTNIKVDCVNSTTAHVFDTKN